MEERFASESDHAECRRLHRLHGTTYYFASRRFPPDIRRHTDALYGFVRVPDEWVDNPGILTVLERQQKLCDFRAQLEAGLEGLRPEHPVLRAFVDTMRETGMSLEEPLLFLDAMEQDLTVTRYETYADLEAYMRGSAAAVGAMMCTVLGAKPSPETIRGAHRLGNAMQMTNFLRDVGEDRARGRIYLPLEHLRRYRLDEQDILDGRVDERFRRMMQFEIAETRALYAEADPAIELLPGTGRRAVRLARILYSRILDRIEARGYDVFSGRARTSAWEKLAVAAKYLWG